MTNPESVKARLKKVAQENGRTFQEMLTYYGLERAIYRISISDYAEHFVLKGGIFLYAIFDRNYDRATTDIDFLARSIGNGDEEMKSVFRQILSLDADDALRFDAETISVRTITEFKEYHGLHVSVVAYLDRTRIPIEIDIGFGDVIYPQAVKMDFPVILDMASPTIYAYSLESSVAEKIEAIIHNGYLNSRYKDFYDIYILSKTYPFGLHALRNAVFETFKNRKTPMTMNTAAFGEEFLNDPMHQTRWNAFLKKKNALHRASMSDVISQIRTFVQPLLTELPSKPLEWNPHDCRWTE